MNTNTLRTGSKGEIEMTITVRATHVKFELFRPTAKALDGWIVERCLTFRKTCERRI